MIEIIPAILPKDFSDLRDKLEVVKGLVKTMHIDFCENALLAKCFLQKSSGRAAGGAQPDILKKHFAKRFFLEAHLMMSHPQEHISTLIKAGFSRVLVQVEAISAEAFAEMIHEWRGATEIGAVLKIETPLSAIDSFVHELKTVQLMGIAHIGSQGQPFDERVIPRVRALHTARPHLTIAVDGGVNKKNAKMLANAGAARLVVGSAIAEFYG